MTYFFLPIFFVRSAAQLFMLTFPSDMNTRYEEHSSFSKEEKSEVVRIEQEMVLNPFHDCGIVVLVRRLKRVPLLLTNVKLYYNVQ